MPRRYLFSWVGNTDLRAASGDEDGLGPLAQALVARTYDSVVLMCDYSEDRIAPYRKWLRKQTDTSFELSHCELSSPMSFGEIYEVVTQTIDEAVSSQREKPDLTFHISPGTSAMAAVWVILSKTRFPAELIQSSREAGVQTVSVPFDISADFIPDLLAASDTRLRNLSAGLVKEAPEFGDILHRSPEMQRVILKARRVAPRSVPVLIEGESGTGKELFARAIHRASPRREKQIISINCGAIPRELVESELFGYVKGAFTGATKGRAGYFEAADGSTLFLDEVGELPPSAQVKLLRVLQEGEVIPVGSVDAVKVDVRIIAATNRDVVQEVHYGNFRADLFYRLAVARLKLPPLRQRQGDVSLLIDRLLEQVNDESKEEPGYRHKNLSASARNLLIRHSWPGNVRELLNTLRQAAIWSDGDTLTEADARESLLPPLGLEKTDILNQALGGDFNLNALMAKVATHYLERALLETHGNKTAAAELVGFSNYQTLTNWCRKYGVEM